MTNNPNHGQRVTCLMIALNEQEYIRRAISGVIDIVAEVIVIDGGSKDCTVEIASGLGARVIFNQWDHDYAAQRNFGLEHVQTEWTLVLDCDEFPDPEFRRDLSEMVGWQVDGVTVRVRNLYFDRGPCPDTFPVRLFKSSLRFEGKIHEMVRPSNIFDYRQGSIIHLKSMQRQSERDEYYSKFSMEGRVGFPQSGDGVKIQIVEQRAVRRFLAAN